MSVSIYLDTRAVKDGKPAPLKAAVRRKGATSFIPLEIKVLPEQWNKDRLEVINHPNSKRINLIIGKKRLAIESAIYKLMEEGEIAGLNSNQLREKILMLIDPDARANAESQKLFLHRYIRFMELKDNPGTKRVYACTLRKLEAFDPKLSIRKFEDITRDYLQDFEAFCAKTQKKNSRNIHLRNIRTVFNDAIDSKVTEAYPFRKYSLRPEPTKKKALSAEQLRKLIHYECEPYQEQYRDIFLLMFMLRGINAGDLFLAKDRDIFEGRFDYRRNKVGTLFSVKLEPEALDIIRKYKGKSWLLNPLDTYSSYLDYLHHLNNGLKEIGRPLGKKGKVLGKGIFPELSSNWARHTWATVASKLDIPKDIISKSLGHSTGLAVTDIYIDFDNEKVDDANRKVIDYVLYGKDYRVNQASNAK